MTSRIFYLDLISNSLGAMLFIFVAVATQNQVRPTSRASGNLFVQVSASDAQAELGLWVRPPGDSAHVLFEDDIAALQPGLDAVSTEKYGLQGVSPHTFLRAVADRTGRSASPHAVSSALLKLHDPAPGCWEVGAYFIDHPSAMSGGITTRIDIEVWYRSPVLSTHQPVDIAGGLVSMRRPDLTWSRPGQQEQLTVEIPSGRPCQRQ